MNLNMDTFYTRNEWITLRRNLIDERSVNGICYCEYCGKPIKDLTKCVGHHKEPLTTNNVNDVTVSLNPDNVMLVHHHCHNEIHDRWNGSKQKKVYLIYGSPCSGKSTYVSKHAGKNDIVLDIDNIWQMISVNDRYIKPNSLKQCVFRIRDEVLDMIRTRMGKWECAYIVGCYPFKRDREFLEKKFKAIPIYMDVSKNECLNRSRDKSCTEIIEKFWEEFEQ